MLPLFITGAVSSSLRTRFYLTNGGALDAATLRLRPLQEIADLSQQQNVFRRRGCGGFDCLLALHR